MSESNVPWPPCLARSCPRDCYPCDTPKCCLKEYSGGGSKFQWPELVGVDAQIAKQVIESEYKIVTVLFTPPRAIRDDFCCKRVYLHVDNNNSVIKIPVIG